MRSREAGPEDWQGFVPIPIFRPSSSLESHSGSTTTSNVPRFHWTCERRLLARSIRMNGNVYVQEEEEEAQGFLGVY
jgi:hypothetical protein